VFASRPSKVAVSRVQLGLVFGWAECEPWADHEAAAKSVRAGGSLGLDPVYSRRMAIDR
jgi:hypothetical protein